MLDTKPESPVGLLRRSPRFDDSNIAVIYEDLGIIDQLPPDRKGQASTSITDSDSDASDST